MQRLRHALVHLALAALILRGLLPAGWMPNPQGPGDAAFVICTMDGLALHADGKALPDKSDPRTHEPCPFAAAASLAPPPSAIQPASFPASGKQLDGWQSSAIILPTAYYARPSSRAPPSLV